MELAAGNGSTHPILTSWPAGTPWFLSPDDASDGRSAGMMTTAASLHNGIADIAAADSNDGSNYARLLRQLCHGTLLEGASLEEAPPDPQHTFPGDPLLPRDGNYDAGDCLRQPALPVPLPPPEWKPATATTAAAITTDRFLPLLPAPSLLLMRGAQQAAPNATKVDSPTRDADGRPIARRLMPDAATPQSGGARQRACPSAIRNTTRAPEKNAPAPPKESRRVRGIAKARTGKSSRTRVATKRPPKARDESESSPCRTVPAVRVADAPPPGPECDGHADVATDDKGPNPKTTKAAETKCGAYWRTAKGRRRALRAHRKGSDRAFFRNMMATGQFDPGKYALGAAAAGRPSEAPEAGSLASGRMRDLCDSGGAESPTAPVVSRRTMYAVCAAVQASQNVSQWLREHYADVAHDADALRVFLTSFTGQMASSQA